MSLSHEVDRSDAKPRQDNVGLLSYLLCMSYVCVNACAVIREISVRDRAEYNKRDAVNWIVKVLHIASIFILEHWTIGMFAYSKPFHAPECFCLCLCLCAPFYLLSFYHFSLSLSLCHHWRRPVFAFFTFGFYHLNIYTLLIAKVLSLH